MSFTSWLIAGTIFIIILTIVLGIGWWLRNNSIPNAAPLNKYTAALSWSKPTAGPNPAKNFCQLYEFPTSVLDINGTSTSVPGNPTFNPLILDNLQGIPIVPSCLDSDQIIAQQQQHTCEAQQGVIDGQITRCYLIDGGTTGLNGTESFYTDVGCSAVSACPGQISLVSVNFQSPVAPAIYCMERPRGLTGLTGLTGITGLTGLTGLTAGIITMQECNPSIKEQLFRVTRTNPNQNPSTLSPSQAQNGLLAQILDRNTGLCVVPGTTSSSTLYDPYFLGYTGCSGAENYVFGTNVILNSCTGGQYPGYVWALIPSIRYCSIPGGCDGCTGCQGCQELQGSNNCSGCDGCTGYHNLITPPQIVYVGNLDLSQAPIGNTGYQGLTGDSALFQWLLDNNAQSLYYGGGDNNLILADIGIDNSICFQKAYASQYMNLTAYNTISAESVCYADQTLGTQYCTGL